MKNILILGLIGTVFISNCIGCGIKKTDPEFIKTINEVKHEFNIRGFNYDDSIPIVFMSDDEDTGKGGTCHRNFITGNYIAIGRFSWKNRTKGQLRKKFLIAHELGHCLLGLDHSRTFIQREGYRYPESLMYPDSSVAAYQAELHPELNEYYFDELLGVSIE